MVNPCIMTSCILLDKVVNIMYTKQLQRYQEGISYDIYNYVGNMHDKCFPALMKLKLNKRNNLSHVKIEKRSSSEYQLILGIDGKYKPDIFKLPLNITFGSSICNTTIGVPVSFHGQCSMFLSYFFIPTKLTMLDKNQVSHQQMLEYCKPLLLKSDSEP